MLSRWSGMTDMQTDACLGDDELAESRKYVMLQPSLRVWKESGVVTQACSWKGHQRQGYGV